MRFYFAPLEGITGYLYRNIHHEIFGGIDKYFTPFVSPTSSFNFKSREKRDVLPENNEGTPVVPQILTNHADEFLYTAQCLAEYGYTEINLNLGCPSGTVVPKGRGAGFLGKTEELEEFLEELYEKAPAPISIKTRIGMYGPDEFEELMEIYNKFPIHELTIHPRVRQDFYKNTPNLEVFGNALKVSKNPICYNGDINTVEDYKIFTERFPEVKQIMIGRGLLRNPALIREITTGEELRWEEATAFADRLLDEYKKIMSDTPVLFKMKEIWSYMSQSHPDREKVWKKIRKSKKLSDYENVMKMIR